MKTAAHSLYRRTVKFVDFATFCYRLLPAAKEALSNSRFGLHAVGKMRRLWLVHYRKDYVRSQLAARQGNCQQCGACCNLLFTCPMLTQEGRCLAYGACRPQACKVFPIDERDLNEAKMAGGKCGYCFVEKNRPEIPILEKIP